jgi:hypothetical protein
MRNERGYASMTRVPVTTRIGVRRIVIEVNRDLTLEQLGMLDDILQRLGLSKATKVTLHSQQAHKPRPQRAVPPKTPVMENVPNNANAGTKSVPSGGS